MDTQHGTFCDMVLFLADALNAASLTQISEPRIKLGIPIAGEHEAKS